MKIFYNITGSERKSLVAAISQELKNSADYLGAPTFAYAVGGYHIDKDGVLEGPDNPGLVANLQGTHGFTAASVEYAELMPEPKPVLENVQIPDEQASDSLTIEMPLDGFTDDRIANLEKLIASKAGLIRKALGVDELPIERTETTLRFPWFDFDTSGEDVAAYTRFISALCIGAKSQQRVTAKVRPVENEKFAFRVFLIRLGFIGDDYKAARKILLKNLSGNSAFKIAPKAVEVDTDE